jgi:hypothetical protein
MPFEFQMVAHDGSDRGVFVTAAPDWGVGDVVMLSPQSRVRILETREATDETLTGEWVVEPLGDAV